MRKASILDREGDKDGKAKELAEAQRVRPETAGDYFLSGQQLYKRKQVADAIRDLEAALRLKPDHFWAKCVLANCYLQTGRFEAAKACLTACLQSDPEFTLLYVLRGVASGQLGARSRTALKAGPAAGGSQKPATEFEFEQAEADFQDALKRLSAAPDVELHYLTLLNRGSIRFVNGHIDQAAADYQEAIRLKKDEYMAHAELAHVYQKQNQTAKA